VNHGVKITADQVLQGAIHQEAAYR
jgi:hypothetical protein